MLQLNILCWNVGILFPGINEQFLYFRAGFLYSHCVVI